MSTCCHGNASGQECDCAARLTQDSGATPRYAPPPPRREMNRAERRAIGKAAKAARHALKRKSRRP